LAAVTQTGEPKSALKPPPDRSTLVGVSRFLHADPEPRFGVVTAHGWHPSAQPHRVIEDIGASNAVWTALMPEANGLGWPLTKQLRLAMQDRPRRLGGGARRRGHVMIDPTAGRSWEDQIAQQTGRRPPWWAEDVPPLPRPAVIRPIHVNAELKSSGYGALRLLIHRGWLLFPASATDLIRELLMLEVEIMPSGLERIETGGRDFASALMLATGPYHHRGEWRSVLLELCEQWARNTAADVPLEVQALPTVRTGGGVDVPRTPAWAGVTDDVVSLPADVELGTARTPEELEREAMCERVWALVNERQEAANGE
jgi:hypothetical protein